MNTAHLLPSGMWAAFIAAAVLAPAPSFEPTCHGWLPRFGWILLRYVLPVIALVVIVSWFLLRR